MANIEQMLKKHIQRLCNPALEGRLSGTSGAAEAANYLADQLKDMDIRPLGENNYFQSLDVPATRFTGPVTLSIGNWRLHHRIDFGEMRLSSVGEFTGPLMVMRDGQEVVESFEGKMVFIPQRPEDFDLESTVRAGIQLGIKGLLFEEGDPRWYHKTASVFHDIGIPVIRIRKSLAEELVKREGCTVAINLPVDLSKKKCNNVIGVLLGKDSKITVALTAHYDHIGDDPAGHRFAGALDNASGVAAILELVRRLLESQMPLSFNLLICFLTGEESGHWGAKHLICNQPLPISAVINLDVLGQNPDFKEIRIGQIQPEHWLSKIAISTLEKYNVVGKHIKGNDDAAVFNKSGIATIGLGEYYLNNIGPRIHTPEDKENALYYGNIIKAIDIVSDILNKISDNPDKLTASL